MSGGDWILTPKHSVSRYHEGGEEEKKRKREKKIREKKEEQHGCLLWSSIWDGICRFYLFIILFLEFVYGQQGCRLWYSIWYGICQIFFFFLEFVYRLSHVGLYLGWDLSNFVYLLLLFLNLCVGYRLGVGYCFLNFFFNCSCLIKLGLMKLRHFKLLIFYG